MNTPNHRISSLLPLSAVIALSSVIGCAAHDAGSQSDEQSPAVTAKSEPIYRESLASGAELEIYQVGEHEAAIGITGSLDSYDQVKPLLEASARETSLENVYATLAGKRALPTALSSLAAKINAVPVAAREAALAPVDASESSPGNVSEVATAFNTNAPANANAQIGDVGRTQQALGQDDTWDWNGDASWFRSNFCVKDNIKAVQVECFTNVTGITSTWWGRYHISTGMAASFNGTATLTVSRTTNANTPLVEYTDLRRTMQPRTYVTWQFLGDETLTLRQFKTIGNGPTPRVHQGMRFSNPKITSLSVTPYQTPTYDLNLKATGFLSGSTVNFYYDHPTVGAIKITSSATAKSDSTVSPIANKLRCEPLQLHKTTAFHSGIVRAQGSDGRVATINTTELWRACGVFAAP